MTPSRASLTVLGLYAENVKRLRVVNIEPAETGMVKVAGNNGAGKSSTLDAIVMALGGKDQQPTLPIRKGTSRAKVVVDLGELRVTRTWTEKESYLTVERRGEKGKLSKPQDLLDSLIGAGLGFDPLEFVERLKPAQQVSTLLSLLKLPEDPRALDVQRKKAYDERSLLNRDVKVLDLKVAGMQEPAEDVPDEEVSVADLAAEHARLVETLRTNDAARASRKRLAENAEIQEKQVADLERQLAEARTVLSDTMAKLNDATRIVALLEDPDLGAITAKMQDAETLNTKIRAKRDVRAVAEELRDKQRASNDLTGVIAALDERKRRLLAEAPFPVPGLGFADIGGDYQVTFNDVPLEQCAKSEQIRVGLAIAMALNPTVRVILLRDGSLLDPPTRAAVESLVTKAGYQLWCELVGEGDAESIVLEDGGVIRAPEGRSAAAPASTASHGIFDEE